MSFNVGSARKIEEWFEKRGFDLPADFTDKTELFHDLVILWSSRMNIISKKDLDNILERHILDSIVPLKTIPAIGNLIDIGSGAGFPAIPIALVRPRLDITLLESQHKKILFLKEVKRCLGLANISIIEARLEQFSADIRFDIATIRALPGWQAYLDRIRNILAPRGIIIYYEKHGYCRVIAKGES